MNCRGRRIVITGASSGLGAALAQVLALRGASLLLAARRTEALAAVARGLEADPDRPPRFVRCDVTDPASVQGLVQTVRREWGGLDALVHNAAMSVYGDTDHTLDNDYRDIMDVNFHGPVSLTREALPLLLAQGSGCILHVLSVAALRGLPYLAAYGASKAALATHAQSLRAELAGTGVRVLNVYPDYVDTPLFAKERRVGSARRPNGGYAPAHRVAEAVARVLEEEAEETVLSARGTMLRAVGGIAPRLADLALARMARRLRSNEENDHEAAQAPDHRALSEPR